MCEQPTGGQADPHLPLQETAVQASNQNETNRRAPEAGKGIQKKEFQEPKVQARPLSQEVGLGADEYPEGQGTKSVQSRGDNTQCYEDQWWFDPTPIPKSSSRK